MNSWKLSVSHPGGCGLRDSRQWVLLVGPSPGSHREDLRKTPHPHLGSGRQKGRGIIVKSAHTFLRGREFVRASGTFHLGEGDSCHESPLNFLVSRPERTRKRRQGGSGLQGNRLRIYSSQGRGWEGKGRVPHGSDTWEGHRPTKTLRLNPRIAECPSPHPQAPRARTVDDRTEPQATVSL